MLIDNPKGNYRFIAGRNPFSSGAVLTRATRSYVRPSIRCCAGRGFYSDRDASSRRRAALNALSGMELRIPQALSLEAFRHFNQAMYNGLRNGECSRELNPVARTNVAVRLIRASALRVRFFRTRWRRARRSHVCDSGAPEVRGAAPASGPWWRREMCLAMGCERKSWKC